jgi:hypothetical protein
MVVSGQPAATSVVTQRQRVASSAVPTATAHAAEADVTALLTLRRPGSLRLFTFVARAVIDALSTTRLIERSTQPCCLGVITHGPTGPTLGVIEQTDARSLQTLEQALAAAGSTADTDARPQLWLSDSSSLDASAGIVIRDAAVLFVGAIRIAPPNGTAAPGGPLPARNLVTLTLSYPTAKLDHRTATAFLLRVVDSIQTRG